VASNDDLFTEPVLEYLAVCGIVLFLETSTSNECKERGECKRRSCWNADASAQCDSCLWQFGLASMEAPFSRSLLRPAEAFIDVNRDGDRGEWSFIGPKRLEGYDTPLTRVAESGSEHPLRAYMSEIGKNKGAAGPDAGHHRLACKIGGAAETYRLSDGKSMALLGLQEAHWSPEYRPLGPAVPALPLASAAPAGR